MLHDSEAMPDATKRQIVLTLSILQNPIFAKKNQNARQMCPVWDGQAN
jgi:hypothetical protein